jgi:hypothetical protein
MKSVFILLGGGLISLLVGCASTPIALAPVGPNPVGGKSVSAKGELQVFSSLVEQSDDQNQGGDGSPGWYQHTDYRVYTVSGKLVKRVGNTIGHYDEAPRRVTLRAGRYLVKAQAEDYSLITIPVTIERGRTTRVHLYDSWKFPAGTPKTAVVKMPNGNPVGWRPNPSEALGVN